MVDPLEAELRMVNFQMTVANMKDEYQQTHATPCRHWSRFSG